MPDTDIEILAGKNAYFRYPNNNEEFKSAVAQETAAISTNKESQNKETEEQSITAFREEYVAKAKKIALYGDPIAYPFLYSKGEGIEKVSVLPTAQLRVFVMGFEVSSWISACTFGAIAQPEVRDATANFTIQCPTDLFTLTEDNVFLNNFNINEDFRSSEEVKKAIYDWKKQRNIYESKTLVGTWNLTVNNCIFHTSDTVRIFSHIPWTEDNAWLPVYTGYISEVSVSNDVLSNRDTIQITLETIASKLGNARFLNNPYSRETLNITSDTIRNPSAQIISENLTTGNTETLKLADNQAIYKDVVNPTLFTSVLTNTTLERLVAFLFYGEIDLAKRKDIDGLNPKLKELGKEYKKLRGLKGNDEANKGLQKLVSQEDFLLAYGSETDSTLRPNLFKIINIFDQLKAQKEKEQIKIPSDKGLLESGRYLYTNNDKDWDDNTWQPVEKKNSLVWRLKILRYIINENLGQLNEEDTKGATLIFDINTDKSTLGTITKDSYLSGYNQSSDTGFGYSDNDFNTKLNAENKTIYEISFSSSEKSSNIKKIEGIKDTFTDSEKNEIKKATISFELDPNGKLKNIKVKSEGSGFYLSDGKESGQIKIILENPKTENKRKRVYIDENFRLTDDYEINYKEILGKRGWGRLDPRLFDLTLEEFPRTGYPDKEIKGLEETAQEQKNAQKAEILSKKDIQEKLKEDLKKQGALHAFLKKQYGENESDWVNKVETIDCSANGQSYFIWQNNQLVPSDRTTQGSELAKILKKNLGIPIYAYNNQVNNPVKLISSKFWFSDFNSHQALTKNETDSHRIKNPDIVKEWLNNFNITSQEGGYTLKPKKNFAAEPYKNPELKNDLEAYRKAKYISFEPVEIVDENSEDKIKIGGIFEKIVKVESTNIGFGLHESPPKLTERLISLKQVAGDKGDKLTSFVDLAIKNLSPTKFNITNNTIVTADDSTSINPISLYVKEVVEIYKNLELKEIAKNLPDDLKKEFEANKTKFSETGLGNSNFSHVNTKFGSDNQYSIDWHDNASAGIDKLDTIEEKNRTRFYSQYTRPDSPQTIYTGPVISFSSFNNIKLIQLIPSKYNNNSNNYWIPSHFMAWAIEAYNYYKNRTGIVLNNDIIKSLESPIINSLNNIEFNHIDIKFNDNWYVSWNKAKKTEGAYWPIQVKNYQDAVDQNQKSIAEKKEGELLYAYPKQGAAAGFEKEFCIQQSKNPIKEESKTYSFPIQSIDSTDSSTPLSLQKPADQDIIDQINNSNPDEVKGSKLEIKAKNKMNNFFISIELVLKIVFVTA